MEVIDYLTRIAKADTRDSQLEALNSFRNDFATASSFVHLTAESSLVELVRLKIIAKLENILEKFSLNFEWLSILRILSRDKNVACELLGGQDGRRLVSSVAHNALYVDETVVLEALGIREAETLLKCRLEAQKVLNNCMLQVPSTTTVFLDLPGCANALLRFVQFSSPNLLVPSDSGNSAANLESSDLSGSCQKGASPNIISCLDNSDKANAKCEHQQCSDEYHSDNITNEYKFSTDERGVYPRLADGNTRIYDLTILVLISLLEKEGVVLLYERYDLFGLLLKLLDNEMTVIKPDGGADTSTDQLPSCCQHFAISKETALLFEQILKALYNVGSHFRKHYPDPSCISGVLAQRCAADDAPNSLDSNFSSAAQLSRKLLFAHTKESGHESVLHPIIGRHVVNMLLCCPPSIGAGVLVGLDPPTRLDAAPENNTQAEGNENIGYHSSKLIYLQLLVRYLEEQLTADTGGTDAQGTLMPVIVLLTSLATHSKVARRYLRSKILPPLKEVYIRPEDARDLRGRMVTLMTAPTDIKNYAALLLYVLCKQNVDRLVKYTGFGNAAGMLADFHLLGAMKQQSQTSRASTDSEDSDTAEYRQALPDINPVIGCVDPPEQRSNPFEGMTEEQKEYEAVQLMKDLSKLMDQGIRPGRITKDGGMQPIEHVLELPNAVGAAGAGQSHRQSDESSED